MVRARSVTSRRDDHEPARLLAGHRGPMQRGFDEVRFALVVDQLEHHVPPEWAGGVLDALVSGGKRLVEVPSLGDRLAIVVADHLEERSTDELVDRPPGQQRRTPIRRLDHPAVVQPHHRIGQIVEEASDVGLCLRQLVDRPMEAPPDPPSLDQGRHDRHDRQHTDTRDDCDRVGPWV